MTFEIMKLKVCEGCGNLWVRSAFTYEVYCGNCVELLAQFPRVGADRRAGRKRKLIPAMQEGVR